MSYDLMVFRKEAAPKTRYEVMTWFENQTKWTEGHDYNDPSNTSSELRGWFMEMIQTFTAMNGPFAIDDDDDEDNNMITGYSIGRDIIYVDFRWSVAELAYEKMLELARKHGVGFFDVSCDEGDILFPEDGELKAIDKKIYKNSKGTDSYQVDHYEKTDEGMVQYTVKYDSKPWWQFW